MILCAALMVAFCASLVSCAQMNVSNPIQYGKKYVSDGGGSGYIFYRNGTGVFEKADPNTGEVTTIEFVWREASDGAVYLFKTETPYPLGMGPEIERHSIYFSEDFLVVYTVNNYVNTFIVEGSELDQILED